MALTQDELTYALRIGREKAGTCGRLCTHSAVLDDGRYTLTHNGTGPRDTDSQTIHTDPALGMSVEKLAERINLWITGLHRDGEGTNLNAA